MTDTPPPEPVPGKPASRLAAASLGGAIGALLACAAIAGAAWLARPKIVEFLLRDQPARLARLEEGQASLAERLAALQAAPAPSAALPEAPSEESNRRLAQLQAEIEQLRRAIPPEGMILRLTERSENAERAMREIAQSQASAQALLLAVGQLRAALERGES
jgi:DNA repair exonuclease SbcCD ATPase subunit